MPVRNSKSLSYFELRHEAKREKLTVIWRWKLAPICRDSAQSICFVTMGRSWGGTQGSTARVNIVLSLYHTSQRVLQRYVWGWLLNWWTGVPSLQNPNMPRGRPQQYWWWGKSKGRQERGQGRNGNIISYFLLFKSIHRMSWFPSTFLLKWIFRCICHKTSTLGVEWSRVSPGSCKGTTHSQWLPNVYFGIPRKARALPPTPCRTATTLSEHLSEELP